jgi:hypothetical protein
MNPGGKASGFGAVSPITRPPATLPANTADAFKNSRLEKGSLPEFFFGI